MTAEEIISYAELSIQSIELDNGKDTVAYDFYKSVLKILQADLCKTCQKVKTTFKQTANEWGATCEPIAEPCEDAVSRQAAIKAIWDGINMDIYTSEVKEILEGLSSVQPKAKIGKWLVYTDCEGKTRQCVCDQCGYKTDKYTWKNPNFCENCGAKMGV